MPWLSVNELAEQEGVSPSTVRRWLKDGLPSSTCDGRTVIDTEQATDWLDEGEDDESAPAVADGEEEGGGEAEAEPGDDDEEGEDDSEDEEE